MAFATCRLGAALLSSMVLIQFGPLTEKALHPGEPGGSLKIERILRAADGTTVLVARNADVHARKPPPTPNVTADKDSRRACRRARRWYIVIGAETMTSLRREIELADETSSGFASHERIYVPGGANRPGKLDVLLRDDDRTTHPAISIWSSEPRDVLRGPVAALEPESPMFPNLSGPGGHLRFSDCEVHSFRKAGTRWTLALIPFAFLLDAIWSVTEWPRGVIATVLMAPVFFVLMLLGPLFGHTIKE